MPFLPHHSASEMTTLHQVLNSPKNVNTIIKKEKLDLYKPSFFLQSIADPLSKILRVNLYQYITSEDDDDDDDDNDDDDDYDYDDDVTSLQVNAVQSLLDAVKPFLRGSNIVFFFNSTSCYYFWPNLAIPPQSEYLS